MSELSPAMPNTPGIAGYLLAIVVSWLVFVAICVMVTIWYAESTSALHSFEVLLILIFTAIFGTPMGLVGALLVHLLCRYTSNQSVHVWTAGAVGVGVSAVALLLLAPQAVSEAPIVLLLCPPIGLAALIGRAVVIPLVTARRAQLASAAPLRVP